ncbi:metabolite traffic protein EboE [Kiritimatiellaeota bacterium B1221]|nr:metabolite traffic protein EboE [Kiritimatiellaeota bacterium B1221]
MQLKGDRHFSYCLNVHPGEKPEDLFRVIQQDIPQIKQALSPEHPFGLGLRIAHEASLALRAPEALGTLKKHMDDAGAYAFTINGFPYGAFHQTRVKEQVYQPDWSFSERLEYTQDIFFQLAMLLPEKREGSISTVPLGYKFDPDAQQKRKQMILHLREMASYLDFLEKDTGKLLHLGLEPEPDCILETTPEAIAFFEEELLHGSTVSEEILRRHLGICLDTCHVAMQFEDPVESIQQLKQAGIRISKTQISAALECDASIDPEKLRAFDDGVYLHQIKSSSGQAWRDLPEFLAAPDSEAGTLRIHAHVPLHWQGDAELHSTRHTLTPEFRNALALSDCTHLEVETYTFDVLPESLRAGRTVTEDMIAECQWALSNVT